MRLTKYKTEFEYDSVVLVREKSMNYSTENFTSPTIVADVMRNVFRIHKETEEHVYIVAVNTKNKPIGFFELSHGTVNASFMNPREIFMKLLLCGAKNFFLVHNHPSQDTSPSKEDYDVTKRVKECGLLLGVELLDHIIIGKDYFSFHEKGVL